MSTDAEIQTLCGNIRSLRKRKGLTQKEMAALMGISIAGLRKLESGTLPPRLQLDAIFSLAAAFSLPPDWFFAP